MLPTVLLASNPFFDAYIHSDFLGKAIFLSLLALSIISWAVILQKAWLTKNVLALSADFDRSFQRHKQNPLALEYRATRKKEIPHPFLHLYRVLKQHTLEILDKNHQFSKANAKNSEDGSAYLSPSDIELIETQLSSAISSQTKHLDKNLFILSTIVTLAPFLGLLGTVWGILTTFSELQAQTTTNTNELVLGGLSLALATTVLGLLDAIPALIGHNYLKNIVRDYQIEMEGFSSKILAAVELHYRKVDVN